MNFPSGPGGLPPVLPEPSSPDSAPRSAASIPEGVPLWRRLLALLLLAAYVGVPAVTGALRSEQDGAMLPSTVHGVLVACATELGLFSAVFLLAAWLARLRGDELWLRRPGLWVLPRAAAWSVGLRISVGLALGLALGAWQALTQSPVDSLKRLRPKVEAMVDVAALEDPVYFALMLTLVSFVLAGLREELWRAGMVALLGRVMPRWFGGRRGAWLALLPVALLFGLAHAPQGPFGVAATTVLGLGLGAVMLFHRSLWDAVLAHGFFNATTFLMLPWLARQMPDLLK